MKQDLRFARLACAAGTAASLALLPTLVAAAELKLFGAPSGRRSKS